VVDTEGERVIEGVALVQGDTVPDLDTETDDVEVGEMEGDAGSVPEMLGVVEMVDVTHGVGERELVLDTESVPEGVKTALPVKYTEMEEVPDRKPLCEVVMVTDTEAVCDTERVANGVALGERLAEGHMEGRGVEEMELVLHTVTDME